VGSLKDSTGQELCQSGISKAKRYSTIQAAVDDTINLYKLPATIWVCPGSYPEQVKIHNTATYQPIITLQGSNLTSGAARITVPTTWTTFSSTIYGSVAAQLLVTDTTGVTIRNLEVDGSGGCPTGDAGAPPPFMAGVMFAKNGNPNTSSTEAGTIQFTNVHDQLPQIQEGCGLSAGIVAENAYIKINDNTIHDVNYSGILQYGGNATMLRNTISNSTFRPITGIRSTAAHPIDVSLNTISNVNVGILLENGTNSVQVDKNNISTTVSTGIHLHGAFNNYVRWNTVNSAWTGISLDGSGFSQGGPPSSGNLVEGNVVRNCQYTCIADTWSSGSNRIDGNKLTNSLYYGIWLWYVADFDQNGTAPAPPPPPFLDWDSIYSNTYAQIPIQICHATYDSTIGWGCAPADR